MAAFMSGVLGLVLFLKKKKVRRRLFPGVRLLCHCDCARHHGCDLHHGLVQISVLPLQTGAARGENVESLPRHVLVHLGAYVHVLAPSH